ncbi:MAG TPA: hypothetical protein VE967_14810 [Gemmatimonadaceae bacterium]|nr:hypothetical protein [Gemmatimonadaceae bacterium]
MHEWTEQAQKEAQDKVFRMAANDASFRELALRDGRAAVEKATGRSLPPGFTIRFVDPAGAHLTAVLPRAAYQEEELAEHELMAVAGGKGHHNRRGGGGDTGTGDSSSGGGSVDFPTSDEG